ncbi:hypothetical protein BX070DRAFT_231320 [Coemansia spiralis]|nr:hypothetical protein BX070DRAFT_231320 [Coemansia spiralis]
MARVQTKRRVLLLLGIKHANDLACAIDNCFASACSTCRRARWLAHPSTGQDLRILPPQLLIARQLLMDLFPASVFRCVHRFAEQIDFAVAIYTRCRCHPHAPVLLSLPVPVPVLRFFVVVHCPRVLDYHSVL